MIVVLLMMLTWWQVLGDQWVRASWRRDEWDHRPTYMKSPNGPQPDDGDSNDGDDDDDDDDGADQHIWRAPTYSSLMVMMVMMVMMIVREPMARQISTNIPQPDDGDGDYDGDGEGAYCATSIHQCTPAWWRWWWLNLISKLVLWQTNKKNA